jgi:hypothetical protein
LSLTPTLTRTITPTPTVTASPTAVIVDDFQCYKGKVTRNTPPFVPVLGTKIVDHFTLIGSPPGHLFVDSKKMLSLCAPADVDGQDPTAPTHPEHEVGYRMRISPQTAKFTKVLNQQVSNAEFGSVTVDVLKPAELRLVSSKSLVSSPAAPVAPTNDHYSCYKVRTSRNTPKFVPVNGVTIVDQFGSSVMTVVKPTLLCAPANVDDQQPGAESHAGLLLCYKLKRPSTTPRFTALTPVYVNNQWGPLTTDVKRPDQLCVLTQIVP